MGELQARPSRSTRRRYARSSAGGASSTGAGSRRSLCRGDASGCLRRAACCSRRWRKTRLVAHQELMLWRDVRRMRPGGEGACVTTLLEMPFGAQRQNFCDAMRDLVVSPAMGVATWSQVGCGRENSSAVNGGNRCESTGVCRRGFVSRILTHTLDRVRRESSSLLTAPCAPDAQSTHLPVRPWPPLQWQCGLQGARPSTCASDGPREEECAEGGTL